jgi:hypothetical protein
MRPRNIVRLRITSNVHSPEFISETLGVTCDKCWRIGDRRSITIIKETNNGWILSSGLEENFLFDVQVKSLLQRITPFKEKMRTYLIEDNIEISCVIYSESAPALNFDKGLISELSSFGASLDIDLYIG